MYIKNVPNSREVFQMRKLTKRTDSFDKINSFGIEYKNWRGLKDVKGVYLMQGYQKADDDIYWAMSKTVCLSSDTTQAERDELDRIYNNPPVVDGELVLIDGEVYKTRLLSGGDYSNTAIFDKVEDTKNV
tara:strand:- start:1599 stop:1988 length:390 start_codon:yes stop_codon:yes gene_type:complete